MKYLARIFNKKEKSLDDRIIDKIIKKFDDECCDDYDLDAHRKVKKFNHLQKIVKFGGKTPEKTINEELNEGWIIMDKFVHGTNMYFQLSKTVLSKEDCCNEEKDDCCEEARKPLLKPGFSVGEGLVGESKNKGSK